MKYYPLYLILLMLLIGTTGCERSSEKTTLPDKPDYTLAESWYVNPLNTGNRAADVFYITPTCIWDWKDSRGQVYHHMNVTSPDQREAVDASARLAAELFSPHANFYSPYYRQITMESWMVEPEETERRYVTAYEDIERAFDYYMQHFNEGRPFILAGHSQGAKTVIELLKHKLNPAQRQQLIAAYVFGFPITQQELEDYPDLQPAQDSTDTGVIISFNSVADASAVSSLFTGNVVCINPLNWSNDTTYAPASRNAGSVFFNGEQSDTLFYTVGARVDATLHSLVADGLNPEDYYIPSIATLFPKGNYHVQEINLYFLNVQRNIGTRIQTFLQEN